MLSVLLRQVKKRGWRSKRLKADQTKHRGSVLGYPNTDRGVQPEDISSLKLYPTHSKFWHRPSHRYRCHLHQHKAYWRKTGKEKISGKEISDRSWEASQTSTVYVSKPSRSSNRFRASLTEGKRETWRDQSLILWWRTVKMTGQGFVHGRGTLPRQRKQPLVGACGPDRTSNRQNECEEHQLTVKLLGLKTVLAIPKLITKSTSEIRDNYISKVINCSP